MNAISTIVLDSASVSRALETGDIAGAVAAPVEPEPEPETAPAPAPIMRPEPGIAILTTVKDLRAALMACGKVMANWSSVPILECVRIEAIFNRNGEFVDVSGTDLSVMVEWSMSADVVEPGVVVIPLKPLKKALVKRKAGEEVTIQAIPGRWAERFAMGARDGGRDRISDGRI